jgi:hypothetical protein
MDSRRGDQVLLELSVRSRGIVELGDKGQALPVGGRADPDEREPFEIESQVEGRSTSMIEPITMEAIPATLSIP